jgi:hypothetical protein
VHLGQLAKLRIYSAVGPPFWQPNRWQIWKRKIICFASFAAIQMPNSVQKKLSNMFARVNLSEKGNFGSKVSSKGVSKRYSLGSPLAKENGNLMGGGDQEAMLSFIEQQGNQISELKNHIASLEAKLLASPPGHCVKPAALFSPARGNQHTPQIKSPKQCISVSQAAFVHHEPSHPLTIITSPAKSQLTKDAIIVASADETSPTTGVHVLHFSQMSLESAYSPTSESISALKNSCPFQQFVDSCLSESSTSPSARPLLASFITGETSGNQECRPTQVFSDNQTHPTPRDVNYKLDSLLSPAINFEQNVEVWVCQVVSFSSQKYSINSVTGQIDIGEQLPLTVKSDFVPNNDAYSHSNHHEAIEVLISNDPPITGATCSEVEQREISRHAIQVNQQDQVTHCELVRKTVQTIANFQGLCNESVDSPCTAFVAVTSPSLDAAAANHAHSTAFPGFSFVSPIMEVGRSNQASSNESAEFANQVIINGLVFSGLARLPEHALSRIKNSKAEFQMVNGVAWVPDCLADSCMLCEREFSLFFRRHHCRTCGIVICSQCSEWNKNQRCCMSCMNSLLTPLRQKRISKQGSWAQ